MRDQSQKQGEIRNTEHLSTRIFLIENKDVTGQNNKKLNGYFLPAFFPALK